MKVSASILCRDFNHKTIYSIKNTNSLTLPFPMMFDIIDEKIKLIACNTKTVTIIIVSIIMYFSIC